MAQELEGMEVAILVTDYFEQAELTDPKKALEDAGARTKIVSPRSGHITGFKNNSKGDSFPVDLILGQVNPDDFDAVLLPGGALNADKLRMEEKAREFVRRIDETDRPIAVICHGGWLLVSAGLVTGRTMTGYYTIQDDIRNAGGRWLNLQTVRDRNWVSSRQSSDIAAFNEEMIELFSEHMSTMALQSR